MITKIDVTDNTFDEKVIKQSYEKPVLVDFWAPWCGPCLMLGPVVEEAIDSDELRDKVILAKADTGECRVKSEVYGITAIPNMKLFKDGKVVAESIGFRPLEAITDWLKSNI